MSKTAERARFGTPERIVSLAAPKRYAGRVVRREFEPAHPPHFVGGPAARVRGDAPMVYLPAETLSKDSSFSWATKRLGVYISMARMPTFLGWWWVVDRARRAAPLDETVLAAAAQREHMAETREAIVEW
jgi:hypothetical protein